MARGIVYMGILRNDPQPAIELAAEKNMASFARFWRANYEQFILWASKTVAERTKPGVRQDVDEGEYTVHAYASELHVCGIIITDQTYPNMVAHGLLSKIVDEFTSAHPKTEYTGDTVGQVEYPELKEYIVKYQNPEEADSIMKIQQELDATKVILHKTIESVLERGEKIDSLVQKSDTLSAQSKMFYTQAKKQNSCCVLM